MEFRKTIESLNRSRENIPLSDAVQQATANAQGIKEPAWWKDMQFFRIAIVGLVLIVLAVVIGSVIGLFLDDGRQLSDGVIALGATAVGALVGIFVKPERNEEE